MIIGTLNAGCLKPVELVIPEGCMLRPQYPAAVVAGNVETSQNITDALYGALGRLAACQGSMVRACVCERETVASVLWSVGRGLGLCA
jgi:N-methylhydantoinase B/oxoprolinase/acetone carboxylase alpha subunit